MLRQDTSDCPDPRRAGSLPELMSRQDASPTDYGVEARCLSYGIIVDLRINETLQTGAVENRTYRVGVKAGRLQAAPTGRRKGLLIFRIHYSFILTL